MKLKLFSYLILTIIFSACNQTQLEEALNEADISYVSVRIVPDEGQKDPTNESPLRYRVIFSDAVKADSFIIEDIHIEGSETAKITLLESSNEKDWRFHIEGMLDGETVAPVISFGRVADFDGGINLSSNSDGVSIVYDTTKPKIEFDQQNLITGSQSSQIELSLSEAHQPVLSKEHFEVNNAYISAVRVNDEDKLKYTVEYNALLGGDVSLSISEGTIQDLAGNSNEERSIALEYVTSLNVNAWIGPNSTEISITSDENGQDQAFEVWKVGPDCQSDDVSQCAGNVQVNDPPNAITDNTSTLSKPGRYFTKKQGLISNDVVLKPERISSTYGSKIDFEAIYFKGKFWIFGGNNVQASDPYAGGNLSNEIWSSPNGSHWQQEESANKVNACDGHQVVEWRGRLWLIGGDCYDADNNSSHPRNDIWVSSDGINWNKIEVENQDNNEQLFSPRWGHSLTVWQDQLWLIGGKGNHRYNDVWVTLDKRDEENSDGKYWKKITIEGDHFSPIAFHQASTWGNNDEQLLIFGGILGGSSGDYIFSSAYWLSEDGVNWEKLELKFDVVDGRSGADLFRWQNRLYLMAGENDGGYLSDIWYTDNLIDWTFVRTEAPFSAYAYADLVVHSNTLYLFTPTLGAWQSEDAYNWQRLNIDAEFSARETEAVFWQDKMWIIGGITVTDTVKNDIWTSTNGLHWQEVEASSNRFSKRHGHQVLVFNNGHGEKLWVIGGKDEHGNILSDTWYSADGIAWHQFQANHKPKTCLSDSSCLEGFYEHKVISWQNKLLIISGASNISGVESKDGLRDENAIIWSTDGDDPWQAAATAGFNDRASHDVVEWNNELWLFGGYGTDVRSDPYPPYGKLTERESFNDLWRSADGLSWTQISSLNNSNNGFSLSWKINHQMMSNEDGLWIIGGYSNDPKKIILISKTATQNVFNWESHDETNLPSLSSSSFVIVKKGNDYFCLGGRSNEVWRSSDLINWSMGHKNVFEY